MDETGFSVTSGTPKGGSMTGAILGKSKWDNFRPRQIEITVLTSASYNPDEAERGLGLQFPDRISPGDTLLPNIRRPAD